MVKQKTMLEMALEYVRLGWHVFPCSGKNPATKHGFKDATTNEQQIKKWWRNQKNIGVATGLLSGFVVVDIDKKHGGLETLEKLSRSDEMLDGVMEKTLWAKTGGGGYHLLFRHPGGGWMVKSTRGVLTGVDVRGDGGYIIAPPSIHPDTKAIYQWKEDPTPEAIAPMPAELFGLIACEEGKSAPAKTSDTTWKKGGDIPDGARNETLYKLACSMRSKEITPSAILEAMRIENAERCKPPLEMREVERIVKSALSHKPGINQNITDSKAQKKSKPKQADILLQIGLDEAKFYREADDEQNVFATFDTNGHGERSPIKEERFKNWLRRRFFDLERKTPGAQAIIDAIGMLTAMASNAQRESLCRRVGKANGKIYVDLVNENWDAVEITKDGWRIIPSTECQCHFIRSSAARSLPYPKTGNINTLKQFLNLKNEKSWILTVAWILGTYLVDGPFPILVLKGEQGSGKSMFTSILKSIIDPSKGLKRVQPKDSRDLFIAAQGSWSIAYDNISAIPGWLSDLFCTISTGGGFATRALYKDAAEVIFDIKRPIILNGIGTIITRQDLIDRALFVELAHIAEKDKRDEEAIRREFNAAKPSILGGIFDILSIGLQNKDGVVMKKLPRMADFAKWVTACEPAFSDEGKFSVYYEDNREAAVFEALEGDPVAEALEILIKPGPWEGSTTDLYERLSNLIPEGNRLGKDWPKSPRSLGWKLARLAPAMRMAGIEIEKVKTMNYRGWNIYEV